MERCNACEQVGSRCICTEVSAFFAEGRDAESKLAPQPVTLVLSTGTKINFKSGFTKLVGVACLVLVLAGCSIKENVAVPGPAGPTGAKGPVGDPGQQGPAQSSCSVSQSAYGFTMTCPDGTSATVTNGQDGAPAQACTTAAVTGGVQVTCPDGSSQVILNGVDGRDGAAGTVITPIQFCTGYVTTYPSSFPEFGFRFGTSIYAVYWNGTQAFMALVPPGRYASTSPQGCSFTINADGTVSQ